MDGLKLFMENRFRARTLVWEKKWIAGSTVNKILQISLISKDLRVIETGGFVVGLSRAMGNWIQRLGIY